MSSARSRSRVCGPTASPGGSNELAESLKLILAGLKLVGAALDNDTTKSIVPALDKLVAGLQQADTAVEQLSTGAGQAVTSTGAGCCRRE